jgi:acyl-CoA synthetase (AMP-forming)/AMP-acid ligase II
VDQILETSDLGDSQAHICVTEVSPNLDDSSDDEHRCGMIEAAEAKPGYAKYPDEPAALMLTSGSTGNAKAVVLEHDQILASIQGKAKTLATGHQDVFFNWIGMFTFNLFIFEPFIEFLY